MYAGAVWTGVSHFTSLWLSCPLCEVGMRCLPQKVLKRFRLATAWTVWRRHFLRAGRKKWWMGCFKGQWGKMSGLWRSLAWGACRALSDPCQRRRKWKHCSSGTENWMTIFVGNIAWGEEKEISNALPPCYCFSFLHSLFLMKMGRFITLTVPFISTIFI